MCAFPAVHQARHNTISISAEALAAHQAGKQNKTKNKQNKKNILPTPIFTIQYMNFFFQ